MTKWWSMFGKDHPEAFGKIEKEEDKEKYLFNTDLEKFDHEVLLAICLRLKIDVQYLYNKYAKTKREQMESHGLKYKP